MKTILLASNVTGGLYEFRQELLETLVKYNKVIVLGFKTGHIDDLQNLGCEVIETPMERHGTNPLTELKLVKKYKKIIKDKKPDVVLTYTIKPNVYVGMACASLGVPYIANVTGVGPAIDNGGILKFITLNLYRYGLRKAQKVFFQNSSDMEMMERMHVVNVPHELIPGSGVNLKRYSVLDYPTGDEIHFLFIARIVKEKGIEQYLEMAHVIRKKYPQTVFHICGNCTSAYEERIKKEVENGTIIYHGRIPDVTVVHKISSCTILPSFYPEGMNNVLLESCSLGRPIITTDRPGCREIIDDGVNGFMVKQKDSLDLIEKVEKFLGLSWEERKAMGLAGRKKVEQEFSRQIVVNKYLEEIG
ncbi:MAG: glycosyltransferase family 4 protein [Saccharofermentans sp.]|nr:glycosyltransferase family 4 protein [Saccharofermentans sp.]